MTDNVTTPVGTGTVVATHQFTDLSHGSVAVLTDQNKVDAMGDVATSPAANTLLGRLKAIATALSGNLAVTMAAVPTGGSTATLQTAGNASMANVDTNTAAAAPASSAGAVTPSDTTTLAAKAIWVGGAGNVVATIGGVDVTFTAVGAGTLLPIKATKIKAATTATNIVWLG